MIELLTFDADLPSIGQPLCSGKFLTNSVKHCQTVAYIKASLSFGFVKDCSLHKISELLIFNILMYYISRDTPISTWIINLIKTLISIFRTTEILNFYSFILLLLKSYFANSS